LRPLTLAACPDRTALKGAMTVATLTFLLRLTVRLLHDHASRVELATDAEIATLTAVVGPRRCRLNTA
jgi:hypothetical protein